MEKVETRIIQQYTRFLLGPVIIAGIFQIIALNTPNTIQLTVAVHALLIITVTAYSIRLHVPWINTAMAGGLAGIVTAAIAALYKFIDTFNVINAFNLFTEPLTTGIIDGIATGALMLIILWVWRFFPHQPTTHTTNK